MLLACRYPIYSMRLGHTLSDILAVLVYCLSGYIVRGFLNRGRRNMSFLTVNL